MRIKYIFQEKDKEKINEKDIGDIFCYHRKSEEESRKDQEFSFVIFEKNEIYIQFAMMLDKRGYFTIPVTAKSKK